jgi:hypothetical protein
MDREGDTGSQPWPKRLRIHKIGEVYSLTCSFSGPNGRALFTIDTDGEPLLTWLALGTTTSTNSPAA